MAGFKRGMVANPRGRGSTPNKSTAEARAAIAKFVDKNAGRFEALLDEIHAQHGPVKAFEAITALLEYHVPKLARVEHSGPDDGPVELVIKWKE